MLTKMTAAQNEITITYHESAPGYIFWATSQFSCAGWEVVFGRTYY